MSQLLTTCQQLHMVLKSTVSRLYVNTEKKLLEGHGWHGCWTIWLDCLRYVLPFLFVVLPFPDTIHPFASVMEKIGRYWERQKEKENLEVQQFPSSMIRYVHRSILSWLQKIQLNPAVTDVKCLTDCISCRWISVIANKGNERKWYEGTTNWYWF